MSEVFIFIILLHCLENTVKCVCVCVLMIDAETDTQKSYRIAGVTRKWEAEKSMVFLWLHSASLETTGVKALTLCQPQSLCDILAFFPFSSKVSIWRARKENHSVNTNSWGRARVGGGSVGVCGCMKITFAPLAEEAREHVPLLGLPFPLHFLTSGWSAFPSSLTPHLPLRELLLRDLCKLLLKTLFFWLLCWLSAFPFLSGYLSLLPSTPTSRWSQICTSSSGLCLEHYPSSSWWPFASVHQRTLPLHPLFQITATFTSSVF